MQNVPKQFEEVRMVKVPSLVHAFPCGAGSPADIDSHDYFDLPFQFVSGISKPYVIEARGDSMVPKIQDGDKLVIDHNAQAQSGDIVVAHLNGNFLVKSLNIQNGNYELCSLNTAKYKPIAINMNDDFLILGVVKWVVSRA